MEPHLLSGERYQRLSAVVWATIIPLITVRGREWDVSNEGGERERERERERDRHAKAQLTSG